MEQGSGDERGRGGIYVDPPLMYLFMNTSTMETKAEEIERVSVKIQIIVVSHFRIPKFESRKSGSKYSLHKHVTVLISELRMGKGGNWKTDKS